MTIGILEILELQPPFELGPCDPTDLCFFYIEAERLITLAQDRDNKVINLYDKIIADIGSSLLSDSKGVKTWITAAYQPAKSTSLLDAENYFYRDVPLVGKLQLIVLDSYDTVEQFYDEQNITVSQTFAFLSETAGYPIPPQYIEDIS